MSSTIKSFTCANGLPKSVAVNYAAKVTKRLPIDAHQLMAAILNGAAPNAKVRRTICTLDDIVQCEYPSLQEMPPEVFNNLYYPSSRNRGHMSEDLVKQAIYEVLAPIGKAEAFDPRYKSIIEWARSHSMN